ncbi:MAG TPA: ABC transporter substrate-binding protein, partial [Trebonia sp.]|nr:ABC transporter substrate-binding protein [Trebonia sp.]
APASTSGSAAGSASGASPASGGTAAGTSIVVGALPVTDTAGLQVAVKEGFFKQAGLNVTVQTVTQSTSAIPDLLHGSIDVIGGGNYVSFLEAQANGTFPVEFLAPAVDCTPDSYGVVAMPSSGITKASDLAGKTIAVNLTQNVQTLTTNAVLKADGVDTASVHYVQVPFPDMVAALQAGRVSAVSAVEPFLSAALAAGGKLVTSTCTGPMAGFPLSAYVTTQTWARQHAAAARAFQQALEKGNAYANAHPDVVRSVLPAYTKITAQAAASLPLGTYPGALTTASLQRIATLMKDGGLAAPSDVSSLIFH